MKLENRMTNFHGKVIFQKFEYSKNVSKQWMEPLMEYYWFVFPVFYSNNFQLFSMLLKDKYFRVLLLQMLERDIQDQEQARYDISANMCKFFFTVPA